ncbi:MAG: PEP-CTERM sorting domain-containing protein [Planctomycetota bacterium]
MRLATSIACVTIVLLCCDPAEASVLRTVEDGQVDHDIDNGIFSVSQVDLQVLPNVSTIPSPPQESQVILEFDLSSIGSRTITDATLRYFVAGTNGAFGAVRLETWFYDGNGIVDVGDFNAGIAQVGLFSWDSPSIGFPSPPVDEFVEFDVADVLNNRTGDFAGFNLRLQGDSPDYGDNEFDAANPFRFLGIASDENDVNNGIFRPSLTITSVPEPSASLVLFTTAAISTLSRRRHRLA